MSQPDPIAIVGYAVRFPGSGTDLNLFWHNILAGRDCSREVPTGRWHLPAERCTDTRIPFPDSVYHSRSYTLDPFTLDPESVGIPGDLLEQLDPLYHLFLDVGIRAWATARTEAIDRRKAGVILGNICLPTDKVNMLARAVLRGSGEHVHPANRYVAGLPAGLLAKALQLGGGTFTLDAACASSLYALKLACDELQSGRADVMLAGGGSRPDCQYTQMGFAQLRALSASGRCSPFDRQADGLMVGEGAGIFVLKRLPDAERDQDQIFGVIRGWGLSNDIHGNLLAPAVEGQLRAMRQAYTQADWDPSDVGLIECHATGTPVGDAVEFESLATLWKGYRFQPGQCVIGSVKSTVGHLLTGAGAAALAKVLLALAHRTLPPQANFQDANPSLGLANSPFRILREAQDWDVPPDDTRKAAVSGFGFGGVNGHLLIEEYRGAEPKSELVRTFQAFTKSLPRLAKAKADHEQVPEPIAIVGLAAHVGPWDNTEEFRAHVLGGPILVAPKPRAGQRQAADSPAGYWIDELHVPLNQYRIPPRELEEMLPQQLLMLNVAARAIADAALSVSEADPRCGVFIGLGLDLNTTNFHLRWDALAQGEEPDATIAPLNANRTMGALGSIAASRIARLFRFGGPSFTCCSEETSSGAALELAVRALRLKELDRAVVGGVDLAGDPRQQVAGAATGRGATEQPDPLASTSAGLLPAEGAGAIVLKRLSEAQAAGDKIYAVISGIGSASGGNPASLTADPAVYASSLVRACADGMVVPETIAYLEAAANGTNLDDAVEADAIGAFLASTERHEPLHLSSLKAQVGETGFASVILGVIKASLALHEEILPPGVNVPAIRGELISMRSLLGNCQRPQFWLKDAGQTRRAAVAGIGADGTCVHVILSEAEASTRRKSPQPLGALPEALYVIEGNDPGELRAKVEALAASQSQSAEWATPPAAGPSARLAVTLVARSPEELTQQCQYAARHLATTPDLALPAGREQDPAVRDRIFYQPRPLGSKAGIVFVFPGSGSHFAGMGRDLGVAWPEILRQQQKENQSLRGQYAPSQFWADTLPEETTPRQCLFGQVALGTLTSDIMMTLGVRPSLMVGQSLGESAGLFGLRVWRDRDEMFRRINISTLFQSDLAPPYAAARRAYSFSSTQEIDWIVGVLAVNEDDIRSRLRPGLRAYLLIVNTPSECVIGGLRADVEWLVSNFSQPFVALSGVTLAHCEAGKPVEQAYRELHTLPVTVPTGLKVISGAWARVYNLTSANAADSITAGLLQTIPFPTVVDTAYREGGRIFLEMGPGASCTRMIGQILEGRDFRARAVCVARQDAVSAVLRTVAMLISERIPVDRHKLPSHQNSRPERPSEPMLTIPVGLRRAILDDNPLTLTSPPSTENTPRFPPEILAHSVWVAQQLQAELLQTQESYLKLQDAFSRNALNLITYQTQLLQHAQALPAGSAPAMLTRTPPAKANSPQPDPIPTDQVPRSLSFEQCTEYAVGKIANVLGSTFAEVDTFPTRVRLPEGPLMLVDRVLLIEGEPRSMTRGRVVTEHTVHRDRWYLDHGRCPTSVTVESGQADLFLSGFLGIDFQTRGLAVYRLLDAVVTFHRGLPNIGECIEYDIHIDEFFRQADAWLFRFRFEGTINGQPLLSMKNGVAGFFTQAALDAGQGIIHTKLDKQAMPGKIPADWPEFVPAKTQTLDERAVEALHRGDLVAAFGPDFAGLPLRQPLKLPAGMLKLVDRVPVIDPKGGRFGLGFVRAEYDIKPKEWFIECHFVDDKVMPGTLMYECCLHTLRTLLMSQGWVGEDDQVVCEPVPGVQSRLKCRGQVLDTTGLVTYEVSIKEIGAGPEPYCIADALMYADGKPVVEILNLSLRMAGLTRESLESVWARRQAAPLTRRRHYDSASIRAYSNGKPSEAFGEPYRIFDEGRILARLPGPPYQFLDEVVDVQGEPFVLKEGARCVAEYTVPPNEWYFEQNRCGRMPFSVLLEIALQPCGWLAAYSGSALTSEIDLSFRNLGGNGTQFLAVTPKTGKLTTEVVMTRVSRSGGMIIQNYDMTVKAGNQLVYQGDTYFGFFAKAALANQVGMPQAKVPFLDDDQLAFADQGKLPHDPPFPGPMLRMVDDIVGYLPRGGSKGLGLIQGKIAVDPEFWFFKAHFYQDPVWPGSLGVESFLQLLKYVAWKKWKSAPTTGWQTVALNRKHNWTYRGQVVPQDREVTVVLEVTDQDDAQKRLTANGFLVVDGRIIYQMTDFTLE